MTSFPNNPSNMWVVPLSLEQCTRQLMGLHEEMRLLAFGYQNRTTVKLKTINNMHLQFELRRVRKTSLINAFAPFVIKGDLMFQSPSATQVSYRMQPNWILVGLLIIYLVFFCGLFVAMADIGFALLAGVFIGLAIAINVFVMAWRANYLKNELHTALSHPDAQYHPMHH